MRIIVSLTSYPKRIGIVDKVIKTLLIQTMKPDKIVLWLSEEEFKDRDLPEQLLKLCQFGLEIQWVTDDLKSHKKYYYAVQEYLNDIVITVDDDMYYHPELIETLYRSYIQHPKAVSCTLVNLICAENEEVLPYAQWRKDYIVAEDTELMDLLPVGAGGVLYPPKCFDLEKLCDEEIIRRYCLYQDDIWLKVNELIEHVSTVLVKDSTKFRLMPIIGTQECALFGGINRTGNDAALRGLKKYLSEFGLTLYELCFSPNNTIPKWEQEEGWKLDKLVRAITKEESVYLYGAGEGAKSVYEYLKKKKLECFIKGFLVTGRKENPESIFNIPVISMAEFSDYTSVVLIATAERNQKEITYNLRKAGCSQIAAVKDPVITQYNRLIRTIEQLDRNFAISFPVIDMKEIKDR